MARVSFPAPPATKVRRDGLGFPIGGCDLGFASPPHPNQGRATRALERDYLKSLVGDYRYAYIYANLGPKAGSGLVGTDTFDDVTTLATWLPGILADGKTPIVDVEPRTSNAGTKYLWGDFNGAPAIAAVQAFAQVLKTALTAAGVDPTRKIVVAPHHEPDSGGQPVPDGPASVALAQGAGGTIVNGTSVLVRVDYFLANAGDPNVDNGAILAPLTTRNSIAKAAAAPIVVGAGGAIAMTITPSPLDPGTGTVGQSAAIPGTYRPYYSVDGGTTWTAGAALTSAQIRAGAITVTSIPATAPGAGLPLLALPAASYGTVLDYRTFYARIHTELKAIGIRDRIIMGVCLTRNGYANNAKLPADNWHPLERESVDALMGDFYNLGRLNGTEPYVTPLGGVNAAAAPSVAGRLKAAMDWQAASSWATKLRWLFLETGTQSVFTNQAWQPNTAYKAGAQIRASDAAIATTPALSSFGFTATKDGVTGAAEPAWVSTVFGSITPAAGNDGTITWSRLGAGSNITSIIDSAGLFGAAGSVMDPANYPLAAAAWWDDARETIKRYPQIAGVVLFDNFGHEIYLDAQTKRDDTPEALNRLAAGRRLFNDPYFTRPGA